MKVLGSDGLTKLIGLVKSSFINNTDVIETQTIDVYSKSEIDSTKQDKLVSGTNIKTINNESILGGGDIEIKGASAFSELEGSPYDNTNLKSALDEKQNQLTSINAGDNIIIGSTLPEGYTQLEYIESDGRQMIDTGVIGSSTLGINIDYEYTTEGSQAGLVGIYNKTLYISTESGIVNYYIELGSRGVRKTYLKYPIIHIKYNAKINWLGNGKLSLNNEGSSNVGDGQTDARKIMLFAVDYDGTYRTTNAKIYGCQISDGSQIIRNFIPAHRESDNKSGMYDTVTNSFFTNVLPSSFIIGENISQIIKISAVVPTKTSELTNDSSYITSDYHDDAKQDKLPTLENGKFLTNNGSTLSWGNALENKATGNYSLTIIGTATTEEKSTNIGSYSSARAKETTAVGANAGASGERAIAIGCQSVVNANNYGAISIGAYSTAANNSSYGIVLGYNAAVFGQYAIQLGCGTNNEANSFYVGLSNSNNYKLLGLDGKIPSDRIPDLSSTYASTTALDSKQDTLVSGTNIKTINGESILGSGDIEVGGDSIAEAVKDQNHMEIGIKTWSGTLAEYNELLPTESWYAWGDYFTKSATPQIGDKIYNNDKTDSGKVISAIGNNTISFEE